MKERLIPFYIIVEYPANTNPSSEKFIPIQDTPSPGHYIVWKGSSYNLTARSGVSWNTAAQYARRKIMTLSPKGTKVTIKIEQ